MAQTLRLREGTVFPEIPGFWACHLNTSQVLWAGQEGTCVWMVVGQCLPQPIWVACPSLKSIEDNGWFLPLVAFLGCRL